MKNKRGKINWIFHVITFSAFISYGINKTRNFAFGKAIAIDVKQAYRAPDLNENINFSNKDE